MVQEPGAGAVDGMVDWRLAVATGTRVAGPGPRLDHGQAEQVVAELRAAAARAEQVVATHTGLIAPAGSAPVSVVGRPGWVQANADAFRELLTPVTERLAGRRRGVSTLDGVGSRLAGLEVGAMLGFLAGKVLGQYDPFLPEGVRRPGEQGRLLLVAPNVVEVEQALGVLPADFRMWVCLHEETHRVQFGAVPWMREHMRAEIDLVLASTPLELGDLLGRLLAVGRDVLDVARPDGPSLLDLVQTPEQREVVDRLAAVMALLEGHADVVMDDVGPQVVPTVATIRARFTRRRDSAIGLSRLFRRLLGLEAKLRQYRDGAAFVRAVQERVGREGFDAVWAGPQNLPRPAEIADPAAWVARVHG
jgi:coenzyme F420 biosynthesis associated uncharacterized protein